MAEEAQAESVDLQRLKDAARANIDDLGDENIMEFRRILQVDIRGFFRDQRQELLVWLGDKSEDFQRELGSRWEVFAQEKKSTIPQLLADFVSTVTATREALGNQFLDMSAVREIASWQEFVAGYC